MRRSNSYILSKNRLSMREHSYAASPLRQSSVSLVTLKEHVSLDSVLFFVSFSSDSREGIGLDAPW